MAKEKSRTDKFLLNVTSSAVLQIVTILTGFVTPRLMLQFFGSEINGLTSSITQYISYIGLVEAGLSNASVYALYKPLAQNDIAQRDAVVSAARISYRNTGIVFTFLAILLSLVYPLIAPTELLTYPQISALVLILCLNGVLNFFIMAKYRALLTADQCNYWISTVSAVQLILHMIVIVVTIHVFSKEPSNVIYVRGLAVLTIFLSALFYSIIVKRKYPGINFYAKPDMSAMNKRNTAMFMQILGVIRNGAPVIIITSSLGLSVVSVYSIYNMVVGAMSTCIDVFTSGLASSFGTIKASGDDKLLETTNEQFRVIIFFIMTVLYSTMLVMLLPFVKLYTNGITDVEYVIPLYSVLITLYGAVKGVKGPYGMLIMSTGKYKEINPWLLIETVFVVFGGYYASKQFGLTGVAGVLLIGSVYMTIVLLWFTPKYMLKINVKKEAFRILRVFVSMAICMMLHKAIGYEPQSYGTWVLYAIGVFIAAVLIALIINLPFDKDIYMSVVQRGKTYIQSKRGRK